MSVAKTETIIEYAKLKQFVEPLTNLKDDIVLELETLGLSIKGATNTTKPLSKIWLRPDKFEFYTVSKDHKWLVKPEYLLDEIKGFKKRFMVKMHVDSGQLFIKSKNRTICCDQKMK